MDIATRANVRTAQAARKGFKQAFDISLSSGLVMSLFASSAGLLGIGLLYLLFENPADLSLTISQIFGFAFGASSVALFARVGGGIYTKAADVGADLVGKVERHIPEDDPRNPAVIADNVGDNVGDVAGMGADLFESYVGAIIAAMAIGVLEFGVNGLAFPLMLCAVGLLASMIASFTAKAEKKNSMRALQFPMLVAAALTALAGFFLVNNYFSDLSLFYTPVVGLLAGLAIGWNTNRYTAEESIYVASIARAAQSGVALTILRGFVVGMKSTRNMLLIIGAAILVSFWLSGLYGIAIAAVAMLSILGISLAIDAFGPVVDNAGGIVHMAGLPEKARKVTDALDAAGNTTAAIGKGFAIGSAALTALALFTTYAAVAELEVINLVQSDILIGLLVGAMLPFYFTSMTMNSVGKAAFVMVKEVRRQFQEIPGLLKGKAKPDYKRCISISAGMALKEMVLPSLIAVLVPIAVGLAFGAAALGGLLVGALVTGVSLGNTLSSAGGAWDNAKKLVEEAKKEKRKTKAWVKVHDALVVGDTVGDPFKDTSSPALNILVKLMTIVSLIFLPLIL